MMNSFRYQSLSQGSVRLLEFSSFHDGELSFNICHRKLDSRDTLYTALSYTWGDPDIAQYIKINGGYFAVRKNLRDALVNIKERFAKRSPWSCSLLWIDAICINQSDADEKAHQVTMMNRIYSQADKVFVWLGVPTTDRIMRLAVLKLDFVASLVLSTQMEQHSPRPFWWPKRRDRNSWTKTYQALVSESGKKVNEIFNIEAADDIAAWQGIVEIWQNPWWTRAWTVQEGTIKEPYRTISWAGIPVYRPSAKVYFLCGRHTTEWEAVLSSTLIAEILLKMPFLKASTKFLEGAWNNVSRTGDIRASRLLDEETDLLEQLQRTRDTECSDPRDKLFANLGLIKKPVASLITPNYRKSIFDTYLDVVRIELEQSTCHLEFLGYAMKLDKLQRPLSKTISHILPSWMPNWDDPLKLIPLPKNIHKSTRQQTGRSIRVFDKQISKFVVTGKAYSATREEPVEASIFGFELRIKGAIIDTIVDRYSFQKGTAEERQKQINSWQVQYMQKYPNGSDFNQRLLNVQVADVRRDIRGHVTTRGNYLDQTLLRKPYAELTPKEQTAQLETQVCLSHATSFRGLCLTKRGHVGLVPWSAKEKDLICILIGGQVLYVLRPLESASQRYQYIGESFIYGLMDGEALDWVQEGNSSIHDFILV